VFERGEYLGKENAAMTLVIPSREALSRARVLVVGDAMLDRYWFGNVDRISPEAPVPVLRVTREEERLGGAANVALNVRAVGSQTSLITVVGNDEPARRIDGLLKESGVKPLLGRDERLYTIVKLRVIGRSQQLLRIDFENDPRHEVLMQMLRQFELSLPEHDAVIFSDYGKGGLTHVQQMINAAREAGRSVLVDPKGHDYSRYSGASVITPNRAELQQVVGVWRDAAELQDKAQSLRAKLKLDALLLTRSEEGMSLFDEEGSLHVAAQAREVFDVTGAGDTVIATLAALRAAGLSFRDAVTHANRAGGLVVGKFGTATVSYEELFA
jgi:rfaE bifunctional protein kinase chain/domain